MREVRAVNKRRQVIEEVKGLMGEKAGVEEGVAKESVSLTAADGSRKWVWGVSRWAGDSTPRVRRDVFG